MEEKIKEFKAEAELLDLHVRIDGTRLVEVTGRVGGYFEVPGFITETGPGCFAFLKGLKSLRFVEGCEKLETGTFSGCPGLEKVALPETLTQIGSSVFFKCGNLREIEIPSKITVIEDDTFRLCSSLTRVRLPDKLKAVGRGAFEECSFRRQSSRIRSLKWGGMSSKTAVRSLKSGEGNGPQTVCRRENSRKTRPAVGRRKTILAFCAGY